MINLSVIRNLNKKVLTIIGVVTVVLLIIILRIVGLRSETQKTTQNQAGSSQDYSTQTDFQDNDDTDSIDQTGSPDQQEGGQATQSAETINIIQQKQKAREKVTKLVIDETSRGDILFYNTKDFQLVYFSKEDEYLISILSPNFEDTRQRAEQTFLAVLGLNKSTACSLDVIISTPIYANPNLGGKIFRLSFCNQ